MRNLFTIGIDVAIIALLVGSMLSGQPMWNSTQATAGNSAAITLNAQNAN